LVGPHYYGYVRAAPLGMAVSMAPASARWKWTRA